MPTFGPWITPAIQTVTETPTGSSYVTAGVAGTTYADHCESVATGIVGSNTFAVARADTATVNQMLVYFDVTAAFAAFTDYTPSSLPPRATGVEYEGAGPSEAWLAGIDTQLPLDVENLSPTNAVVQARATVPPFDPITGGITFVSGASLTGLSLIGTLAVPSGTSDTGPRTLTATIPPGAIANGAPGVRFATALLNFDGQISHVGPTDGHSWVLLLSTNPLTAAVHYQPRRYRFIYSTLPRLRQFPRDDALGGAPRQGKANGATSVQGSTRQGWRGTYR